MCMTTPMKPAAKAPVTWWQYFGTCPQMGNHPALAFPFFPTWAIANAAEMLEVSNIVKTCTPDDIN